MIKEENGVFKLDTDKTSYKFCVTDEGHLEHIHYGAYLRGEDFTALRLKNNYQLGSSVAYDKDAAYCPHYNHPDIDGKDVFVQDLHKNVLSCCKIIKKGSYHEYHDKSLVLSICLSRPGFIKSF